MAVASLERWLGLCRGVTAESDAVVRVFSRLQQEYETPPREYHNLSHVAYCLTHFDAWVGECDHPAAVELAIWFHDVVYDVRRTDNEEQSALLAQQLLADMKVAGWVAQDVTRLILATKHQESTESADDKLMQDVDLAILGAPAEVFDRYERAIRQEYAWVEERTWRRKRSAFLQSLLARSRIYQTTSAYQACERAAYDNLERAVAALREGGRL